MAETICGTFPAHAGNNNGTFTVRDDSITVNYTSAPDIYEINVHYADGTSQSFGTNFGSAPTPGSIEWAVTLKSPAKWVQVHSFNDHYGEPSCPADNPAVEPPVLNDPEFQWVPGEPVIDCEGVTVTVVSHEEAAGWYWGNDGEQHLGGFFPTGNIQEKSIPATAEECPAPPPEENPVIDTPEYKPDTETQTGQDVSQPEQLAVTGGGMEWTALIIGAAFVAAGLVLYLKRPKR